MTYQEFIKQNNQIAENNNKEKQAITNIIMGFTNYTATELYLHYHDEVKNADFLQQKINMYLYDNVASQYILGYTYFYGLKIEVNKNVLIPRLDTEVLVEEALNNIPNSSSIRILDLCTGSGCIAIAIKKHRPLVIVDASDISKNALEVAKKNSIINNVNINFIESDIFGNINEKYDIIVSNPPYIDYNEKVDCLVKLNEPALALYAKNNGLYFYEEILKKCNEYLKECSLIAFEIGESQATSVSEIAKKYLFNSHISIKKDLNGKDRVVLVYNDMR